MVSASYERPGAFSSVSFHNGSPERETTIDATAAGGPIKMQSLLN